MKLESISRDPAIITFKRGTVIKVDHFKIIKPKRLLIMGIGEGSYSSHATHGASHLVANMPEFGNVIRARYDKSVPSTDDYAARYGEDHPIVVSRRESEEKGHYNARTYPVATYKFAKIITANLENVLNIKRL